MSVLNYTVTSNHAYLLVRDCGKQEISASMQLAGGCVAHIIADRAVKEAFWEDRYHATAVATDEHLVQCLVYMDLNMVRAGVVNHPRDWTESGYSELVSQRQWYRVTDIPALMKLIEINANDQLVVQRKVMIDQALAAGLSDEGRDSRWSGGIAVGSYEFVDLFNQG